MIFSKNNRTSLGHFLVAFIFLVFVFVLLIAKCAYGQKGKKEAPKTVPVNVQKCVTMDSILWVNKVNILNYIAYKLRNSDLPSKETTMMVDSLIIPFQMQIYEQVMKK